MSEELKKLLEMARSSPMSKPEKEEQRRSFAFGNTAFENPAITREMVNQQAEKLEQSAKQ